MSPALLSSMSEMLYWQHLRRGVQWSSGQSGRIWLGWEEEPFFPGGNAVDYWFPSGDH